MYRIFILGPKFENHWWFLQIVVIQVSNSASVFVERPLARANILESLVLVKTPNFSLYYVYNAL